MDDRQIVTMYFARNESALAVTQQKYGAYVMSIAQNILDNLQDAQECLNDALLKLWNAIPPEQPRDLKAYIAKNLAEPDAGEKGKGAKEQGENR